MTDSVSKSDCGSAKEGELITRLEEAAQEIKGEVAEIRAIFTGPIPPPEMIGAYESALPGLANRIMMMAESEGQHRHAQEQKALDAEIETKRQALNADIESNKKLVDAHIREVLIINMPQPILRGDAAWAVSAPPPSPGAEAWRPGRIGD
jgi:uncharacterized membrane protein